jgi:chromatin assembly factor 1 subunit A
MPHATPTISPLATPKKRKVENDENSPLFQAHDKATPGASGPPAVGQPANANAAGQPPPKKKRASKEEIEAKKKDDARIKQEKEAVKAAKAAEKAAKEAKLEAEKKAKAEERERKRKLKEEEEAKKLQEQARKAAEKEKKLRSQPTLGTFFKKAAAPTEKKEDIPKTAAPTASQPEPEELSIYEQMFKPFFVKDHVTVAPMFHVDAEAREAKGNIFQEYVEHKRGDVEVRPFKPLEALELPFMIPRGRMPPTVRSVMAEFDENSQRKPIDLTADSQQAQARNIRETLQQIPMKLLCFKEDVRPPYYGTITTVSGGLASLRKLARNPTAKDIILLNYDYDSEAEWQDDEGEDIDLADEEEDDVDGDEDMDDFLDDSEDVGLTRLPLVSGLEPESTGICWENRKRLGPAAHMYKFRMEFILGKPFFTDPLSVRNSSTRALAHAITTDTLDHHTGIDPFSTEYWDQPKPTATPAVLTPNASKANSILNKSMAPPAPADALRMLAASAANAPRKGKAATVVLKGDMVEKLKDMIVSKKGLSKVGIIELFSMENKVPKAAVKTTLEVIAMKTGKDWVVRPDA